MSHNIGTRYFIVRGLIFDRDDLDGLCKAKERKRVCSRTGRSTATVPT